MASGSSAHDTRKSLAPSLASFQPPADMTNEENAGQGQEQEHAVRPKNAQQKQEAKSPQKEQEAAVEKEVSDEELLSAVGEKEQKMRRQQNVELEVAKAELVKLSGVQDELEGAKAELEKPWS